MKRKLQIFLILLYLICITSCSHKQIDMIQDMFNDPKELKHEVLKNNDDEFYSKVYKLLSDENYLIAYDFNRTSFFSKTDFDNDNKMYHFGIMGQGPNEVLAMPSDLSLIGNKEVSFYSINQNSLYSISYKENSKHIPNKIMEFDEDKNIFRVLPVAYNQYIALGGFDEGRYLLLDKDGNDICYSFNYPSFDEDNQFTKLHKFLAFQGDMMIKPGGKRFYFAGRTSEIFDIIEIHNNEKLKKIFSFEGQLATFIAEGDGIDKASVPVSKESKMFFIDTNCTDTYIYLLYSNKIIKNGIYEASQSKSILVFDWKGKPITSYELDIPVNNIAVNNTDEILYGYSRENEKMVKFRLN